jgi:endogenous inhibitor of DNA gyrase (YacG/DUF329 family)
MAAKPKCQLCGKAFAPATFWQRFCSRKCRTYVSTNRWREREGAFKTRRPRDKAKAARYAAQPPADKR